MKILISVWALLLSISVQAQDLTQHMKFMGIPMDCDANTFAKKLEKEKGLKRGDYGFTEKITLLGDFSGYKDCLFIIDTEGSNPIGGVGVIFQKQESFQLLLSQYQTMKTRLTTKYGKPTTEVEGFQNYEPSTDYGKLRELREGNAMFETNFIFDEGQIKLQMCCVDLYGYLQLLYIDFKNAMIQNDKALDDL